MTELRFTIPGRPVTKKNSQRIFVNRKTGTRFVSPSGAFKAYQEACGAYIPHQWTMLEGPLNLKCVYYMPTRRRVDLCNLLGATCDILVHYGMLKDDNSGVVASHDGSRVLYDKDHPRVDITITEVQKNEASEE